MDISIMYRPKVYALSIREETEMCRWIEREKQRKKFVLFLQLQTSKNKKFKTLWDVAVANYTPALA